jgi:hypothetical protein
MRRLAATLALALASTAGAQQPQQPQPQGQQPPQKSSASGAPAAAPPRTAQEIARELLPRERWNQLLDSYAQTLSRQLGAAASQGGGKTPEDLEGKLRTQLRDEMKYEETVDLQARALAKAFSPDELKRVAQFYGTPVGKKLLAELPRVQAEVSEQLQEKLSQAVPRIVGRVAPEALPKSEGGRPGAEAPPAQGRTPPPSGPGRPERP